MTHQNLRLGKCWKLLWATLNTISVVYFLRNPLVYRKKFTDDYYPSGYFRRTGTMGWWWLNTIAPRDQFNPIRLWENLVVNYHLFGRGAATESWQKEGAPVLGTQTSEPARRLHRNAGHIVIGAYLAKSDLITRDHHARLVSVNWFAYYTNISHILYTYPGPGETIMPLRVFWAKTLRGPNKKIMQGQLKVTEKISRSCSAEQNWGKFQPRPHHFSNSSSLSENFFAPSR